MRSGVWEEGVAEAFLERSSKHRIRFKDGKGLIVSGRFRADPRSLEKVSSLLLHAWDICGFTSTRWVTMGRCARGYQAFAATGGEAVIRRLIRDEDEFLSEEEVERRDVWMLSRAADSEGSDGDSRISREEFIKLMDIMESAINAATQKTFALPRLLIRNLLM